MYIGKNQYLFSKEKIDSIEYARHICIGDYNLYIGDSCECAIYENNDKKVCVLGVAVDVASPEKTVDEMCEELLSTTAIDTIGPQSTSNWCGRWVVVLCISDRLFCWHDACGLKQVFYEENFDTLASQARYIANAKGYRSDDGALAYLKCAKEADKEYALPVDATLYAEVKRLLPNHFIDMNHRSIERSNLRADRKDVPANAECARALRNAMSAARRRKPLAVTLTAGWDSRLVLASCCDLNGDFDVVTLKYDWMPDDNEDIVVAGELCKKLELPHTILSCHKVDEAFMKRYVEHSENAHDYWMQMAQAIENNGYADRLWVKGSCNEILRVASGNLYNWQVDAKILCKLFLLPQNDYSLNAINNWLLSARPYCKTNGLKLLDLFYWEHRMGSWLAECANEADVVGEMFTPFNSRRYILSGFAAKANDRKPPQHTLFYDIMDYCRFPNTPAKEIYKKEIKQIMKYKLKYNLPLLYGVVLKVH